MSFKVGFRFRTSVDACGYFAFGRSNVVAYILFLAEINFISLQFVHCH